MSQSTWPSPSKAPPNRWSPAACVSRTPPVSASSSSPPIAVILNSPVTSGICNSFSLRLARALAPRGGRRPHARWSLRRVAAGDDDERRCLHPFLAGEPPRPRGRRGTFDRDPERVAQLRLCAAKRRFRQEAHVVDPAPHH